MTHALPTPILPPDHRPGDDIARAAVAAFLSTEIGTRPSSSPAEGGRSVVFTGLGTVAHRTMTGAAFAHVMATAGVRFEVIEGAPTPAELLAQPTWDIALCFSPWKEPVAAQLPDLTETAQLTGAVDTVLRRGEQNIGININTWAAQAALESAFFGSVPASVLILGSGASARSVGLAVRRAWGLRTELTISARNVQTRRAVADRLGARSTDPTDLPAQYETRSPAVVVNCTAWGETADSERAPFPFQLPTLLTAGSTFQDLNNRVSGLQIAALESGARVLSGTSVRDINNACRAALARSVAQRHQPVRPRR